MNTKINIKNFRIFDENGVLFDLKPITILTGSNSSGKSSVVKAILLLQDFCQQLKKDYEEGKIIDLDNYKIEFHSQHNSVLGSFDHVLHRNNKDLSKASKRIIIEIELLSYWLLQKVIVHLEFGAFDNDKLNNGYLMSYSIRNEKGNIIFSNSRDGKASMDFSCVKSKFLHFLYGQHIFAKYQEDVFKNNFTLGSYDESLYNEFNKIYNCLSELENGNLVSLWQVSHNKIQWRDGSSNSAESLIEQVIFKNEKHKTSFLQNIDEDYIFNSLSLGVYCYFPCLIKFKDHTKKEVIKYINDYIFIKSFCINRYNRS